MFALHDSDLIWWYTDCKLEQALALTSVPISLHNNCGLHTTCNPPSFPRNQQTSPTAYHSTLLKTNVFLNVESEFF